MRVPLEGSAAPVEVFEFGGGFRLGHARAFYRADAPSSEATAEKLGSRADSAQPYHGLGLSAGAASRA